MYDATIAYAPLVADGTIAGIHFEGPYLSEACCGAQNPAYLRALRPRRNSRLCWMRRTRV